MIRNFLKSWLINAIALAVLSWFYSGIKVSFGVSDFLMATLLLTIISKLIKPIFEVVFLPLNILTLGLFRWLRTLIALTLLTYLAKSVSVVSFSFPGLTWGAFEVKQFSSSPFVSLIFAALLFNLIGKIIRWLTKAS